MAKIEIGVFKKAFQPFQEIQDIDSENYKTVHDAFFEEDLPYILELIKPYLENIGLVIKDYGGEYYICWGEDEGYDDEKVNIDVELENNIRNIFISKPNNGRNIDVIFGGRYPYGNPPTPCESSQGCCKRQFETPEEILAQKIFESIINPCSRENTNIDDVLKSLFQ